MRLLCCRITRRSCVFTPELNALGGRSSGTPFWLGGAKSGETCACLSYVLCRALIVSAAMQDRVTHYFLERVFIPRLNAKGVQVHFVEFCTMLRSSCVPLL
jgi:hypothetical protein